MPCYCKSKGRLQDTVAEEIPLAPTGVVSSFSEGNQPPSSYDIASLLSDGDQDESSDDINDVELKDQPTSPGMPSLSLDEAVIPEGRLSSIDGISDQTVAEATSLTQTTPGSSSPKSNQPPSKIDIPSFASDCHQDELLDDEKGAESGDLQTSSEVPSSSLDDPADAFAEDALRSNLSPKSTNRLFGRVARYLKATDGLGFNTTCRQEPTVRLTQYNGFMGPFCEL